MSDGRVGGILYVRSVKRSLVLTEPADGPSFTPAALHAPTMVRIEAAPYWTGAAAEPHWVHWPSLPPEQAEIAARAAALATELGVSLRVVDVGRPRNWWAKLAAWSHGWAAWPVLVGADGSSLEGAMELREPAIRELLLRARPAARPRRHERAYGPQP